LQWQGTAAVIGRALALISAGSADQKKFSEFAKKFGLSDRHFRRLFVKHLGASPMDIVLSKRLHFAKQLLLQTSLPVTEVGYASGFNSIRRFNDAFKSKFKDAPTRFRKAKVQKNLAFIEVELPYIPPFDWSSLFNFMKNHGIEGVENFEDGKISRCFLLNGAPGMLEVSHCPGNQSLRVRVDCADVTVLKLVLEKIRDLFDLRVNPHQMIDTFSGFKAFNPAAVRIPGAWDPFETAVCIILGQLVSAKQAKVLVKRLVAKFGTPVKNPCKNGLTHYFPSPQILTNADIKKIGITKSKESAIKELSKEVLAKRIDLSRVSDLSETRRRLLEISGIGPWTVELIAMRCLGDTNAFPKTDLIVKRAMKKHCWVVESWSPWKSYAAIAIWNTFARETSPKRSEEK